MNAPIGALALDARLSLRRGAVAAPAVALRQPEPAVVLDPAAQAYVSDVVHDNAVVMFALEWCEFCWAVRKLFANSASRTRAWTSTRSRSSSATWAARSAPC